MLYLVLTVIVLLILSGLLSVLVILITKERIDYGVVFLLACIFLTAVTLTVSQRQTNYVRTSELDEIVTVPVIVKDVLYTEDLESGIYEITVEDYISFINFKITIAKRTRTKVIINVNSILEVQKEA